LSFFSFFLQSSKFNTGIPLGERRRPRTLNPTLTPLIQYGGERMGVALREGYMIKKILRKLGLPILALAGVMMFVGTPKADAQARFGVYLGGPAYPYAYPYPYGYGYPYYYDPYAYPYGYSYPYPYYGGGFFGGFWGGRFDHRDFDHRERGRGFDGRGGFRGNGFHGGGGFRGGGGGHGGHGGGHR
jgi:uncharacterized membrane protein YgcG